MKLGNNHRADSCITNIANISRDKVSLLDDYLYVVNLVLSFKSLSAISIGIPCNLFSYLLLKYLYCS